MNKEIPVPPFITWYCSNNCKSNGPFCIVNPENLADVNASVAIYKCIRCMESVHIAKAFWHFLPACEAK